MKLLESAENYLECILILNKNQECVKAKDICSYFNYTKASVSIAMKNLKTQGLINIENNLITLTKKGEHIAKEVYDKHLVVTKVLVHMGVDEETASLEACKIEHILSDDTVKKMKLFINNIKN